MKRERAGKGMRRKTLLVTWKQNANLQFFPTCFTREDFEIKSSSIFRSFEVEGFRDPWTFETTPFSYPLEQVSRILSSWNRNFFILKASRTSFSKWYESSLRATIALTVAPIRNSFKLLRGKKRSLSCRYEIVLFAFIFVPVFEWMNSMNHIDLFWTLPYLLRHLSSRISRRISVLRK